MKTLLLISLVALAPALQAQTNAPAAGNATSPAIGADAVPTNSVARTNTVARTNAVAGPTEIFSDNGEFDLKTRVAVYTGNVRVTDPQMKLTCDVLTASVPDRGRPNEIVAEHNVVMDATDNEGRPIHATGDKAVYTYKVENSVTNETIVLTGHAIVVSRGDTMTGEPIIWDRARNTIRASHPSVSLQPEEAKAPATNPPPVPRTAPQGAKEPEKP